MKSKVFTVMAIILPLFFAPNGVWAGNIVIKGSTTVLPIAQKTAEAYMKQNPDVKITISGGGSGNGIKALIDGSTDIADSSRFIKTKEVKRAVEKGRYPVPFAVAYDCIVPVVHASNNMTNITMARLKDIYMGKIKNWKDIGGPDRPIVVISRDTSSGTYEVWREKVLKKERVFPGALLQASNGAVAQVVAKNKNAVGYIGLGYMDSGLKALTVNNVKGSNETTLDGTFPVSRPLYMFTPGWPKGDTLNFINFVMHPQKGQKLVSGAGVGKADCGVAGGPSFRGHRIIRNGRGGPFHTGTFGYPDGPESLQCLPDARIYVRSDHLQHLRGCHLQRTHRTQRGIPGPGCHPVGDHMAGDRPGLNFRYIHGRHPRHVPGHW